MDEQEDRDARNGRRMVGVKNGQDNLGIYILEQIPLMRYVLIQIQTCPCPPCPFLMYSLNALSSPHAHPIGMLKAGINTSRLMLSRP